MKVPFVQFHLPNGRQTFEFIELPDTLKLKVDAIHQWECRLTAEVLGNGICSFCVEHYHGDFDMELCPNGPEVPAAITELIERFDEAEFKKWASEMEEDKYDPTQAEIQRHEADATDHEP